MFDIQKEQGTTYGHVKLKPGLYNIVMTFEKLTDPVFYEFEVIPSKSIIDTFKEKYSDYEIIEYLDSKGFVWKYTVKTSNNDVEIIFGDDRTILRQSFIF